MASWQRYQTCMSVCPNDQICPGNRPVHLCAKLPAIIATHTHEEIKKRQKADALQAVNYFFQSGELQNIYRFMSLPKWQQPGCLVLLSSSPLRTTLRSLLPTLIWIKLLLPYTFTELAEPYTYSPIYASLYMCLPFSHKGQQRLFVGKWVYVMCFSAYTTSLSLPCIYELPVFKICLHISCII